MRPDSKLMQSALSARWQKALAGAGFARNGDGNFHHDKITFRCDGNWLLLETVTHPAPPDGLYDLSRLGLWKRVAGGPARLRVFEIPAAAICSDEEADWNEEASKLSLDAFLAWALASLKDSTVPGWQPPARSFVESWMETNALTVQAGATVRQGELILSPQRWAVRFPILPVVRADLPVARREWLRAVLADAQSLWRLARLGFAGEGENLSVVCEVDLTGAPPSEKLFSAGVNSVRHAVASLAETVEVLADATIASQLLALAPSSNNQERKETP